MDAAAEVVAERFCPEAVAAVRRLLANPVRSPGDDVGVVAFDGDRAIGVTGSIVRRLHLGREPFAGINGGFLAMRRDAPATLLYMLLRRAHNPRFGSVFFYSNTCSPATAKVKPCVGVGNMGPESWAAARFARLRRYPSFRRRVKRGLGLSLPERPPFAVPPVPPLECVRSSMVFAADGARGLAVKARADFSWADRFFEKYLDGNDGVVGSRTTRELGWLFGDAVSSGGGLALAAEGPNGVAGYAVVVPCMYDRSRWHVADAIALGNDVAVLSLLFRAAKNAVRACSDAERLGVAGFPAQVQPLVEREFPERRPAPCNEFMWGFSDALFGRRCEGALLGGRGWFFGPYDGDFCMCPQ